MQQIREMALFTAPDICSLPPVDGGDDNKYSIDRLSDLNMPPPPCTRSPGVPSTYC